MAYKIEITEPAEFDISEALEFVARDSIAMAEKWARGLDAILASLEELPNRFPVIPESASMRSIYRATQHYSHRIVYRVEEAVQTVYLLRVYHEARRPLTQIDLQD